MKPKITRMLSMVLCAVMVLAVFAGCANNGKNPADTTSGEEVTTQPTQKPAFINYRGENLTVTDGTNPIESGAQVPAGTVVTVSYDNRAVADKVATVKLNKETWLTAQPGENASKTLTVEENVMYSITVELAVLQLDLSIGEGVTVVNKEDNEPIADGTKVPYGTQISVTVASNDKLKITKLSLNDAETDVMLVNAERTIDYTVTENMAFAAEVSDYPIAFTACDASQAELVNAKTQGIDSDGYLAGPNINKYSQTGFVTLPKNAVFTTTVKMNRGYSFGVNLYISDDPTLDFGDDGLTYRVSARPWFKINNVGDFHSEYISLNNNGTVTNIELSDAPVNDEVTIRLVLDSVENKVYLFVNNEEFTEQAGIAVTANSTVRANFYYLCEADQEAGVYKTWSIACGTEAVAKVLSESRPATFAFDNAKLSVADGDKNVENGGKVNAGKTVTVSYDNSAENENVAVIKSNGEELFRVLPNQKGSELVVSKAYETYNLTVEFVEADKVTVNVASGMTVVKKSDGSAVADGASVPQGTVLLVTLSSDDKTKIRTLLANETDTCLKVVNATQTFAYSVTENTALAVKEEDYPTTFEACSMSDTEAVGARTQGMDSDGYLYGPNINKWSQAGFVLLNQDAVYTVTVKMNRSYSFGVNLCVSEDPAAEWGDEGLLWYRILTRPWFKTNGEGGFHYDYISLNNNNVVRNVMYDQAPTDDEVTLKLIFDHTAQKVYVFANGEEFTDIINIVYGENDRAQINFYYLCELDQVPGRYKTWSIESGAEAVAKALAEMRVAAVTYTDAKLSVKDGETVVASGAEVEAGKVLTLTYDNTADAVNTARIRVNGEIFFEVAPAQSGSKSLETSIGAYEITVELAAPQVTLTYESGMTVTDAEGHAIASGTAVNNGTVVKVTLASDDKQKIETLYANGVATDLFTVNATQIVSYRVLADTALSIVESAYPITFTAASSGDAATVNAREQGINSDGYLVAPNINKYAMTNLILLNQDAVFTTTVKMNSGYSFGVNMHISEDPKANFGDAGMIYYRVNARPWFKDSSGVGDFRSEYISFNNNNTINNIQLAQAPADDEVTIKLIFDHTNGKAYVFVNGEDFTDRAAIPYTSADYVQIDFYGLCQADGTAQLYKTWSIQSGADAVAAALAQ